MPVLRLVDGEKRYLLSLRGMWQHQWMFIRKQPEDDMAKSVNKVILVGKVGQDPEVRYTASGIPVAKVSLATNERFKDRNELWQDKTEWHTVVAWQRLAEIVGEYVRKGSKLYVEGKLQTSTWGDRQNGEKKYRTEIVARDIVLLGSRDNGHKAGGEIPSEECSPQPTPR